MNIVSPKHLSISWWPFRIFSKIRRDIRGSRCTTGVVDTGGKLEKIFNQKNFNYFVWTPLGSRVTININFCLQIHFKEYAAWYCFHILPPVSLIPVANLPPVSTTLAKLVANCHQCRWYRRCTLTCEYLREFSKKFETVLMGYSGSGEKMTHEKNQKQKISLLCPFMSPHLTLVSTRPRIERQQPA